MNHLIKLIFKKVPLWIKCPIALLFSEMGRWSLSVVLSHMRRSFAQSGGCGEAGKRRAEQAVQKTTYAWVRKHYGPLVKERAKAYTMGQPVENGTVWVFWWQGEENVPIIVQRCIASIRKHAGDHPVQVIDQNNFFEFVTIPEYINRKREMGIISLTHFSDYLRMALLAQHGGLWLDATIFVTENLNQAFCDPIFTVRNPGQDTSNISDWNWTGFAFECRQQYILPCLMCDLFNAYWSRYNKLIDYFIIDYFVRLIHDNCDALRNHIQNVPPSNANLYYYQKNFNSTASGNNPPTDTWLYKLSWKGNYLAHTKDGEETVYGRWIRETEELLCRK